MSKIIFEATPKVSIREFLPELLYEFSDAGEDALSHYVLRVITKIARTSNALKRTATICVQHCVENYMIEPVDCMEIISVSHVTKTQHCGCGCSEVVRLTHEPHALMSPMCGHQYAWFEFPNTLWISPVHQGDQFNVIMNVAPRWEACDVDKKVLTDMYDVVMDGVKAQLFGMKERPWFDRQLADSYDKKYKLGTRMLSAESLMGGQRGVLRAKRMRVM